MMSACTAHSSSTCSHMPAKIAADVSAMHFEGIKLHFTCGIMNVRQMLDTQEDRSELTSDVRGDVPAMGRQVDAIHVGRPDDLLKLCSLHGLLVGSQALVQLPACITNCTGVLSVNTSWVTYPS